MRSKKKLFVTALVAVIIAAMGIAALAEPGPQTANPTESTVYVNGVSEPFEAYNIGGSNYFKLRDLAYVLNGTEKQFEVGYDNDTRAITLTSGQAYTAVGGEMAQGDGSAKLASPTESSIYFDGEELNLTVYNIGGNNFFKLRDLMEVIDVYVGYDSETRAITLDTSREYELELQPGQPNPPDLPSNTTPPEETSPTPPETTTPPGTPPPAEETTPTIPTDTLPPRARGWAIAIRDTTIGNERFNFNIRAGEVLAYREGEDKGISYFSVFKDGYFRDATKADWEILE